MNCLVAKGFKHGGKVSITSAIQSMMRIKYGLMLGPSFSLFCFVCLFTDNSISASC